VPVKRRFTKRRGDPVALEAAWLDILAVGFDHFGELEDQGVPVDSAGQPHLKAARAAWAVYGQRVMAARNPDLGPAWGEEQFGPPGHGH
jgi:hypothetical protein